MVKDDPERDTDEETVADNVRLRPMNCELNAVTRTDGSALLTQGETAVLASMYGPIEGKAQNLEIDHATIEVYFRPKSGLPSIKDRLKESIIKGTCETALLTALHPRTAISIQIQEMENRCGLMACSVNAACLALLIGGIEMKFTVAAMHSIIDKDGHVILDPDHRQAIGEQASFTFVFDSVQKNLIAVNTNGRFNTNQYNEAFTLSRIASENIFQFYRKIIEKSQIK